MNEPEKSKNDPPTTQKQDNPDRLKRVRLDQIKVDAKIAAVMPAPSIADRARLKEGLGRDGQQVPLIVTPDYVLLDGHTRRELLLELEVEHVDVLIDHAKGTDDELALRVLSLNVNRRQLNDYLRGVLILSQEELVQRIEANAKKRMAEGQLKGGQSSPGTADARPPSKRRPCTRDRLAKLAGLRSGKQLDRIKKIVSKASAEDQAALAADKATINEVYSKIRRAERIAEAKEKAAALTEVDLGGVVIHGDAFASLDEYTGVVDLVIVDPPYGLGAKDRFALKGGQQSKTSTTLPEWDRVDAKKITFDTLDLIAKLLREGGSFYLFMERTLVGAAWERAKELGLSPRNEVIWVKPDPCPHGRNNWASATEHVLYGVKGKGWTWNLTGAVPNVIHAAKPGGKVKFHDTQKPEVIYETFMKASSNPGDLAVDFMAGSGTCGAVAKRLKRSFVLVEQEENYCAQIKTRLAALSNILESQARVESAVESFMAEVPPTEYSEARLWTDWLSRLNHLPLWGKTPGSERHPRMRLVWEIHRDRATRIPTGIAEVLSDIIAALLGEDDQEASAMLLQLIEDEGVTLPSWNAA